MDNKLLLIFILLFLSFLLLFYYIKLKTNIIMFLSIIIVLCVNKLIIQKEYYTDKKLVREKKQKLIKRGIIDYMLKKKPESKINSFMPFLGSVPNQSTATTSVNTNKKQPSWDEILTNMREEIKTVPVNEQQSVSNFSFSGSIESPNTSGEQ